MNVLEDEFLSEGWVRKVVQEIEYAKRHDEKLRSLASEFSLGVAYIIDNLPENIVKRYGQKITVYVELDKGVMKHFSIGLDSPPEKNPDYTVESKYDVAKKIFSGDLSPGTAFVKRYIKVGPMRKVYGNPAFTAKSLVTFGALLQVIKKVPTTFPS